MRAAITGHLVLSTLHTNDAVSAIDRLEDIGIEPYLVSGALKGVISQRLVRKICPHCRREYLPNAEELRLLGMEENADAKFYIGEGCPECHHSGYHGRQAVFEILTITKEMRQMIAKGATAEDIMKLAEKTDFVTMKESCRKLVSAGITSIEEAMKAINSTLE